MQSCSGSAKRVDVCDLSDEDLAALVLLERLYTPVAWRITGVQGVTRPETCILAGTLT